MIKKSLIVFCALIFSHNSWAAFQSSWVAEGDFAQPESAYFHASSNSLFVSNIAGEGMEQNGLGWISKLSPTGEVVDSKWVKNLNAPKGMRSVGNFLYVSDINRVIKIDMTNAKVIKEIPIEGAKFLNDVAVDNNGNVYVSDTLTSSIHMLINDKPKVFVTGAEWESPNGLLVQGDFLIVAAWGLTKDFQNKTSGKLYKIHLKTKKRENISGSVLGNLDGLEVDPSEAGRFFLSDWVTGAVFTVYQGKAESTFTKLPQGSADIALVPTGSSLTIVVPQMQESRVQALSFDPALKR